MLLIANAFESACAVEQRAMEDLMPFLESKIENGRYVLTAKGRLSEFIQKEVGDVVCNLKNGDMITIEIKAEEENKTGNFFLETWSNRKWYTVGWMITLKSDYLWYYFLKSKQLFICNLPALKAWAFHDGNIYKFDEKPQRKRTQMNDTWGRCVPISILKKEIKLKEFSIKEPIPF